ncbi:hypothetical protein BGZ46_005938 [Entomortierella lignicola]|nr:hypothetical protein BGZ46_005938 [Entomortierella lignicola]
MDFDDGEDFSIQESIQTDGALSTFSIDNLPAEFRAFLAKNEIDPAIYTVIDLPRYVRLNPDPNQTITPEALAIELGTKVEPVPGLETFCRLSGQVKLRNTQAYKESRIFGMDLSSGIAVYALDVQPGDHVLDICCAPGAKLCMIAGLLTNTGNARLDRSRDGTQLRVDVTGTVTGVDISPHRLSTCRSLLKRHRLQHCARLFQADGTTFGVMRPSSMDYIRARIMSGKNKNNTQQGQREKRDLSDDESEERDSDVQTIQDSGSQQFHCDSLMANESSFKRQKADIEALASIAGNLGQNDHIAFNGTETNTGNAKLTPFYAPKTLRNDPQLQTESYKYDKVIVDAECTHDGSIAHILKYEAWGWDSFHKNFMSQDRLDSLSDLQRGLLMNGFRLAKAGGIVVYSTCSLSRAQNEDIIAWFLARMQGRAVLEPLPKHALGIPTAGCKRPCRSIIANALGIQNTSDQGEWHGTAEQEAEMEQFQNHIVNFCLRYDPIASHTSGFFIARIRKLA